MQPYVLYPNIIMSVHKIMGCQQFIGIEYAANRLVIYQRFKNGKLLNGIKMIAIKTKSNCYPPRHSPNSHEFPWR
jgi:hypothetical protein